MKCTSTTPGDPARIVPSVTIVQLLDHLPEAIVQRPGRVWNVLARSLGEQGADGRTALAWRWALTGDCPSPVSLGAPLQKPPNRSELLSEAGAAAPRALAALLASKRSITGHYLPAPGIHGQMKPGLTMRGGLSGGPMAHDSFSRGPALKHPQVRCPVSVLQDGLGCVRCPSTSAGR
jgi:hypothetical protein